MKKKKYLIGILVLLAAAAGILFFYLGGKEAETPVKPTPAPSQTIGSAEQQDKDTSPDEPAYVSPIDFDALHEINSDIYAWIEIMGTDMSFPIVQHPSDDDYYLKHTIEGKKGFPGSIYTQCENRTDFSKFNTIVYGHNMYNGTMFSDLTNYRDEDYFNEHREIKIYTPDAERTYTVFAAVVFDDRLLSTAFDEQTVEGRWAYLDAITAVRDMNSHVLNDVEVTANSQILTLSTCIKGRPENRYLIEAVLVDVQS